MHLVKTLSTLALAGACAPTAFALSIKDDTLAVNLKFQVQERVSLLNDASDPDGDDWDPLRAGQGEAEFARFELRRARLGFAAKWGDWKGNFQIRAENNDRVGAATGGRAVQLYYANAGRSFKMGDIEHEVRFGLDKPFNTESSISSSQFMFPDERAVSLITEVRGVGIGYLLRAPFITFGFDIQNNLTGTKDPQAFEDAAGGTESETNGMFYSARIEFAPGQGLMIPKRQESYCGKEGTGVLIGFDYQLDQRNLTDDTVATTYNVNDTTTFGPDLLVHWNYLTFLAEYKWRKRKNESVIDATGVTTKTDFDGTIMDVQAGWSFIMADGTALEPAIRYEKQDLNKDVDSVAAYSGSDFGGDGSAVDFGLSWYLNGHSNKIQLDLQLWKAEDGDADAKIVRLQHQWAF